LETIYSLLVINLYIYVFPINGRLKAKYAKQKLEKFPGYQKLNKYM